LYKPGPDSSVDTPEIRGFPEGAGMRLCAAENLRSNGQPARLNADADRWLVSSAAPAPPVGTTGALQAYDDVLAGAGSRAPQLDSVDQRIIADVRNGTGHIIDDPADVGGWPDLTPGAAAADTDADGMPDEWETRLGLDSNTGDSARDRDHDGYTNIEEYINALLPTPTRADSAGSGACSRS